MCVGEREGKMLSYLYEWVQNIAYYMILVTVVVQVIPKSGYKKYIRFFTGLLLILLMCEPILKVAGMEDSFMELYHKTSYEQEQKEMEEKTKFLEDAEIPSSVYNSLKERENIQEDTGDDNQDIGLGEITIGQ